MFVKRLAFLLMIGPAPGVVLAQTAPPAPSAEPVDTSALAYYAAQHDQPRVDAELRRLRSLYPNWQPPADPAALVAASTGEDENKPLWDLFGADKLDELDAEIARRKSANPAWTPPADLVAKLAVKRARIDLIAASERKDYPTVVDIVARNGSLVTPDDLDVSWRVADAYGRTGASDKALKIDQGILSKNQDPAMRLATVRKAMATLAPADLNALIGAGRPGSDGRSEFDAVGLDLVRQRVGTVLAGGATETAAPGDLARLEVAAKAPGGGSDAALLGWWYSKQHDWSQANTWFQAALKAGPAPAQAKPEDAKVAQGAVLALQALKRPDDAEALAYQWRDADPALGLQFVGSVEADLTKPKPIVFEESRLKRFTEVVAAQQSGNGAQALGWYAYNIGQFRPAEAWFRKAMTWQPRDTTALGLALSLKQLGDKPGLAAFLKENGPNFPALAAITPDRAAPSRQRVAVVRDERIAPAAQEDAPPRAEPTTPRQLRIRVAARPRGGKTACTAAPDYASPSAALTAGWCLMSLDRPQEAAQAFAAARGATSARGDAAYGEALANLRINRTDAAVMAAGSAELSGKRRSEIGMAALSQSATAAFDQGRYEDTLRALDKRRMFAAEPRDLAVLRAWSRYHTGHEDEARALFSTLDAQLSTRDTRAGVAATRQPSRF